MMEGIQKRSVRSYVRREGRVTPAQREALVDLWPRYGLDLSIDSLDFPRIFKRHAPVVLEIGFGNGDALAVLAKNSPERDYIGIEVHRPGVGQLLRLLEGKGLNNVRVISEDAVIVLRDHFSGESLAQVLVWFPDPWPKKRHHKRRLVQPEFVRLVHQRLAPGGQLHLATDWEDYALHMLATVEADGGFENTAGTDRFSPRPPARPMTRFEQRSKRLGHSVWDLIYRRV